MDLIYHIEKCAGPLHKKGEFFTREFIFPADFPGFDGHFPGNPILPGVIQTLLGELSSAEALKNIFQDVKLSMNCVTRCKFVRPVKPGEKLNLEFSLKAKGTDHVSICTLSVEGEKSATYQLLFSPEEN